MADVHLIYYARLYAENLSDRRKSDYKFIFRNLVFFLFQKLIIKLHSQNDKIGLEEQILDVVDRHHRENVHTVAGHMNAFLCHMKNASP
jgi:hypothetical protein